MHKKTRAFTLIELMVTLALFGILVSLAAPQFTLMSSSNRLVSQINQIAGDLSYARSEAVKRGLQVTVTANAGGWSTGWVVAADGNTLKMAAPLKGNNNLTNGGVGVVTFNPDGSITGGAVVTFRLCDPKRSGSDSKQILISATGRPSVQKGSGDCA